MTERQTTQLSEGEMHARMWVDLLTTELAARSAQHNVTNRALLYLNAGLPLERVLDALKISPATWYRRLSALDDWRNENRAAARTNEPLGSATERWIAQQPESAAQRWIRTNDADTAELAAERAALDLDR